MTGIADQTVLDNASKIYHQRFQEIFERGAPGLWKMFCAHVPTDAELNEIDLLGSMPVAREWEGEKVMQAMRAYSQSVRVTPKEVSFELDFLKMRYDRTGLIGRRIAAFLSAAGPGGRFYDKFATDMLISNPVGYDGQALFSATHPHVNGGAGGSNLTASALSPTTYQTGRQVIMELADEGNEPFALEPKVLMVGPKNEKMAREICEADERVIAVDNAGVETGARIAAAASTNVFRGTADVYINPRFIGAADDYWAILSPDSGVSPVVCFEGRAPEPHMQTDLDAEGRFRRNKVPFSIEADLGFGPGVWIGSYMGRL